MVLLLFVDLDPQLAALGALGGFFALRTGVPPHGLPRTLAHAYAAPRPGTPEDADDDPTALRRRAPHDDPVAFRVRKVADGIGAPEPRVAASVAQQGLAARLWSIALGSAVVYGRLPDLDPELLHWDPDAGAPDDLWLAEVRARPVADLDAMVRAGHLVPLNAALRSRYRVAPALLWGNAGSALAGAVRQLDRWALAHGRPEAGERAGTLAAGLFAHPDLAGTLDPRTLRRRSCCLYYRVPGGGVCGDCCFDRPPGRAPGPS
ncbi:(2Fe-2S)-binding protein [Streptomyces sp. NPDC007084]|uniref:(2Fe-2S)-binding protein n=1 Tax=Streptomyces sp. NPDC007084 TaxID=3154313 RepID=UPI0034518761